MALNELDRRALQRMQANDPDGWTNRVPTDAHRAEHRKWCRGTFGERLARIYLTGGWDDDREHDDR